MTTLRDKIIKALIGSSGQNPVMLDALRKIAEPICDDLQQLYTLLDQLYAARTVNRASGFKDSKQYVAYWETGAPPPAITFRITQPAPPQRVHRLEPPAKVAATQPQPTQETTMPQKQTTDRSGKLCAFVLDLITKQPGISKASIVEYTEVEFPNAGDRIRQTLGNLVTRKQITGEGKRGSLTYRAIGSAGTIAKATASAPPQAATKPNKDKPQRAAAKKVSPAKPAAAPTPVTAKHPAAFDPEYSFAFGVRKDGGVAICKDGISVVLARSEVQTILAHTTQE